MRLRRTIQVFFLLLIFYVLQRYIHAKVSKYLSDGRLSRSSAMMQLSVDIGAKAKLLCPVRTEDLRTLLWTKIENGNRVLIGNYSSLVIKNDRFSVSSTRLTTSDMYYSWLMIEDVREEDGGTYLCHNRFFNRTFMDVDVEIRKKSKIDS